MQDTEDNPKFMHGLENTRTEAIHMEIAYLVGLLYPGNINWIGTDLQQSTLTATPRSQHTMIQYPTKSDYPDMEQTSWCPILLMPSSRLGIIKH